MAEDTHPLVDIAVSLKKRMDRLGSIKGFDGEQSRRELRDEIYPAIAALCAAALDIEERVAGIEDEEGIYGVPEEVAMGMKRVVAYLAIALEIAKKHVPETATEDRAALGEIDAWCAENLEALQSDVDSLAIATDEEDDGDESEDEDEDEDAAEEPKHE